MVKFKIVVSDADGKSHQLEVENAALIGKKIGDEINGSLIGLEGYKLKITGGSDKCGFPMRHDIHDNMKMRVLLSKEPGYKPSDKGIRKRKSVRGNTISSDIVQINTKVIESGDKPISELIGQ
ncbi:30S ribosomal protein S6e [Methanothermococcus sp. SCGC AD-155-K20]|nr:30S ribosomal protein S6e [Methanothermococcus sp. SCGC AD-155-K20]